MALNDVQIIGLKEVIRAFDKADKEMVKQLRKAVKDSAKPVLKAAREKAPTSADGTHGRPKGTLKKDLTIIAERSKNKAKYTVRVGQKRRKNAKAVDSNGTPYGGMVEYGTSKTPAQPFMGPALDENRDEVQRLILEELINKILK